MNFIMIYHFYQKEWKLKKVEKLATNLHDKTDYVIHIRNLKQALNYGLVLKIMENVRKHRNIKLVTIERRTNHLVSERNYHTEKLK